MPSSQLLTIFSPLSLPFFELTEHFKDSIVFSIDFIYTKLNFLFALHCRVCNIHLWVSFQIILFCFIYSVKTQQNILPISPHTLCYCYISYVYICNREHIANIFLQRVGKLFDQSIGISSLSTSKKKPTWLWITECSSDC